MSGVECRACVALAGLTQCNACRRDRPNAQTVRRRRIMALANDRGISPIEAERILGVGPGPSVN